MVRSIFLLTEVQIITRLFQKCIIQTQQYLKEGALNEDRIFESINKLVNLCRDCNVTLRWLILHTTLCYSGWLDFFSLSNCVRSKRNVLTVPEINKRCKQIREHVITETKLNKWDLLHLLLNISEFELTLKEFIKQVSFDVYKYHGE